MSLNMYTAKDQSNFSFTLEIVNDCQLINGVRELLHALHNHKFPNVFFIQTQAIQNSDYCCFLNYDVSYLLSNVILESNNICNKYDQVPLSAAAELFIRA